MVHDTLVQHGVEIMHSPAVHDVVSFIKVGPTLRALSDAGYTMAQWVGDHLHLSGDSKGDFFQDHRTADHLHKFVESHLPDAGPSVAAPKVGKLDGQMEKVQPEVQPVVAAAAAPPDTEAWGGGRMVEFFAQSCPHCQHLEPVWKDASSKWLADHQEANNVKWEQKECYGGDWGEGKDHDECMKEGIHSFPTIRFYSKSGNKFANFTEERSPERLLGFAASHSAAPERVAPLEETRGVAAASAPMAAVPPAGVKVVEYVAKSCPHCQHMEPVWKQLQSKKDVLWEQKECFAEGWAPGKDLEDCKKADIQGFPTIKMFGGNAAGAEYEGARTVEGISKWVDQRRTATPAPSAPSAPSAPTAPLGAMKAATVQAFMGPLVGAAVCAPASLRKSAQANFL